MSLILEILIFLYPLGSKSLALSTKTLSFLEKPPVTLNYFIYGLLIS